MHFQPVYGPNSHLQSVQTTRIVDIFNPFKVSGGLESSGIAMYRESNAILSHDGTYIQLCFLRFDIARSFVFFLNPSVVSFLQEKLSCVFL